MEYCAAHPEALNFKVTTAVPLAKTSGTPNEEHQISGRGGRAVGEEQVVAASGPTVLCTHGPAADRISLAVRLEI